MAAGSIVVDLLMKTGSFETDTKRAEKRLAELKKEAEQLGRVIGVAFVAVGVASIALVKSAIDAADATSKLAQQTGTTVEELSALTYAAGLADVSQQELGSALVKLTKNMSDAAMGTGEAIKGFDALGISVKNADGTLKGSDQVLAEIADQFAGFADGAEKTALAVNLFGRSGAQLIPLLNAGSAGLKEMKEEAARLGVVLDTETAQSAEAFNDNLTKIGQAISGIGNRAATELLPALNDVSDAFVDLAKSEEFIATTTDIVKGSVSALIVVFQTIAVVVSDVGFVLLSIGREIGALAAQFDTLRDKSKSLPGQMLDAVNPIKTIFKLFTDEEVGRGFTAISDAVKADGERARKELDKFQARIMAIGQPAYRDPRILGDPGSIASQARALGGPAPRITNPDKPTAPKATEAERYLENLQKQVEATRNLTTVEQLLSEIQSGRLKVSGNVTQKQLEEAAAQVDAAKFEAEQRRSLEDAIVEEREARLRSADAALAEAASLIEGNKALEYEIQLIGADEAARRALEKARLSSAIAAAKDKLATVEATDKLGLETQAIRDQIAALERRSDLLADKSAREDFEADLQRVVNETNSARDQIEGTLGYGLYQAMSGNFKDIGDDFVQMLNRMVAEALAAEVMNAVFGERQGGASGGGSAASGLGNLIGSVVGSYFGGAYADGGRPPVGKVSLVGERGPELFIPNTAGVILPANQTANALAPQRPVHVTNNFTVQGNVDRRAQSQIAAEAGSSVQRALARNR